MWTTRFALRFVTSRREIIFYYLFPAGHESQSKSCASQWRGHVPLREKKIVFPVLALRLAAQQLCVRWTHAAHPRCPRSSRMELWWHRARVTAVTPCLRLHGSVGANLSNALGPRYLAELVEARFSSSCSLSLSSCLSGFPWLSTWSKAVFSRLADGAAKLLLKLIWEPYIPTVTNHRAWAHGGLKTHIPHGVLLNSYLLQFLLTPPHAEFYFEPSRLWLGGLAGWRRRRGRAARQARFLVAPAACVCAFMRLFGTWVQQLR